MVRLCAAAVLVAVLALAFGMPHVQKRGAQDIEAAMKAVYLGYYFEGAASLFRPDWKMTLLKAIEQHLEYAVYEFDRISKIDDPITLGDTINYNEEYIYLYHGVTGFLEEVKGVDFEEMPDLTQFEFLDTCICDAKAENFTSYTDATEFMEAYFGLLFDCADLGLKEGLETVRKEGVKLANVDDVFDELDAIILEFSHFWSYVQTSIGYLNEHYNSATNAFDKNHDDLVKDKIGMDPDCSNKRGLQKMGTVAGLQKKGTGAGLQKTEKLRSLLRQLLDLQNRK